MSALTFRALRRLADGHFHSGEAMARSLGRSRATLCEALKRAPELGIEIHSVRGKGYRLASPLEFLDRKRVLAAMEDRGASGSSALSRSRGSGVKLEIVDEVDSTSTRLLERAGAGAESGSCLAAEWQSAGRGRRGRTWVGNLGGSLTFSLLWRFERGAGHLAGLSLASGSALAAALADVGLERVQVKWPNDLVLDFRKLAGILVETSGEMQGPSVAVIGVGINHRLGRLALERIDQPVADVVSSASPAPSRSALLGRCLARLVEMLERFERDGFEGLRAEWRALHAYQGRRVRIVPASDPPYDAEVLDVAPDGALIVAADGRTLHLTSGEISLRKNGVRPHFPAKNGV